MESVPRNSSVGVDDRPAGRQVAKALGDPEITAFDVAGAIRAKLIPLYALL